MNFTNKDQFTAIKYPNANIIFTYSIISSVTVISSYSINPSSFFTNENFVELVKNRRSNVQNLCFFSIFIARKKWTNRNYLLQIKVAFDMSICLSSIFLSFAIILFLKKPIFFSHFDIVLKCFIILYFGYLWKHF